MLQRLLRRVPFLIVRGSGVALLCISLPQLAAPALCVSFLLSPPPPPHHPRKPADHEGLCAAMHAQGITNFLSGAKSFALPTNRVGARVALLEWIGMGCCRMVERARRRRSGRGAREGEEEEAGKGSAEAWARVATCAAALALVAVELAPEEEDCEE